MIQHTIAIPIARHQQTVEPAEIADTVQAMRRHLTDELAEYYGTDGHLSYRWELSLRTVGGNTLLRTWAPGEPLPVGSKAVTLIGQGFAHEMTREERSAGG